MVFTSISRHLGTRRRDAISPSEVRVQVRGGYHPDTIRAAAGTSLRIVFRREESSSCSEQVVFPAFGKSATLPQGEDVTVNLLPAEPGEYQFTCAMGMLQGRLVITPAQGGGSPGPTPANAMRTRQTPGPRKPRSGGGERR